MLYKNKKMIAVCVMLLLAISAFLPVMGARGEQVGIEAQEDVEEDPEDSGEMKEGIRDKIMETSSPLREISERRSSREKDSVLSSSRSSMEPEISSEVSLMNWEIEDADETWDDERFIGNNIVFTDNATLTITGDAEIYFNGTYGLYFEDGANLVIDGEQDNKALLTSNYTHPDSEEEPEPGAGDWIGIQLNATAGNESSIEHAEITYSGTAIYLEEKSPPISGVNIFNNLNGIFYDYIGAEEDLELEITNSNVSDNQVGIIAESEENLTATLEDIITSGNSWGIAAWSRNENSTATLEDVTASGNDEFGIYLGAENDLDFEIVDSVANDNGEWGGGIYTESSSGNLTATFDHVTSIENEDTGIYSETFEGSLAATFDNVNVSDNEGDGIALVSDEEISVELDNVTASDNEGDGIVLESNEDITAELDNVTASRNDGHGIVLESNEDITAELDNVIASRNDGHGIALWSDEDISVELDNVTASDNEGIGIFMETPAGFGPGPESNNEDAGIYQVAGPSLIAHINNTVANSNAGGIAAFAEEDLTATLENVEASRNDGFGVVMIAMEDLNLEATDIVVNENGEEEEPPIGILGIAAENNNAILSNVEASNNYELGVAMGAGMIPGENGNGNGNLDLEIRDSEATCNEGPGFAIFSDGDLDLTFINNVAFKNGEAGVVIEVSQEMDLDISGNEINENDGDGLVAWSDGDAVINMVDNHVQENNGDGVFIWSGVEDDNDTPLPPDNVIDGASIASVDENPPMDGTIEDLTSTGNTWNGLYLVQGGDIDIHNSELSDNDDSGLRIEGGIELIDCDIDWAVTIEDNTIQHNYYGIHLTEAVAEVNNNIITYNRKGNGAGIHVEASEVELLNNVISNNLEYGIQIEGVDSRTDWIVTDEAIAKNNPIQLSGNLHVEDGGVFTLENVDPFEIIIPDNVNNRFGITVDSNSEFQSYNSDIYSNFASFTFEVENSHLKIVDSYLENAHSLRLEDSEALIHGTMIEESNHGGIEAYDSDLIMKRTIISEPAVFGIYLDDSTANLLRTVVHGSETGIEAHDSDFVARESIFNEINYASIRTTGDTEFELYESFILTTSWFLEGGVDYDDFIMSGESTGELYEVEVFVVEQAGLEVIEVFEETIDEGDFDTMQFPWPTQYREYEVMMEDDTTLDVYWSVIVNVTDVFMDPIPDDTVSIYDNEDNLVAELTTDYHGLTQEEYLHQMTLESDDEQAGEEITYHTPHEFSSETTGRETVEVIDSSRMVRIIPGKNPVFVSEPTEEALLGETYYYNAESVDPRNRPAEKLTFSLYRKPEGMSIDSRTGEITWKPTAEQIGNHIVTVRVRNQNETSRYALQEFEIEVINEPPKVYNLSPWDEASDIATNTTLSADIQDNAHPVDVEFYLDGDLVYRKTIYEDKTVETDPLDLEYGEDYEWELVVTDKEGETTSEVHSFTTEDREILPTYGWIIIIIIIIAVILVIFLFQQMKGEEESPPEETEEEPFEEESFEELEEEPTEPLEPEEPEEPEEPFEEIEEEPPEPEPQLEEEPSEIEEPEEDEW